MKHIDLVVHVLFLCVAPWLTECTRSLRRVHSVERRLNVLAKSENHNLHHGSDAANVSEPVMMNHARFSRLSQDSAWPRDAQLFDESLEHTFRGDDFLESSSWKSKPRVNECKNVRSLSQTQAHKCDLLEMQIFTSTASYTSDRFYAREFVGPYPNKDQVNRLREGPLKDFSIHKLRRVTFVVHGYMGGCVNCGIGEWEKRIGRELAEGGSGTDATIVIDWTRGAHASWEDCHGMECLDDYAVAMADARVVGKYIQRLAAGVREVAGDVQLGCIGHSVGAHVCGFASKYMALEDLPGGKLHMSRISGLDPAGPSHSLIIDIHAWMGGRSFVDPGYHLARLNRNDADFVDIYISDPGGFGYDVTMAVKGLGRDEVEDSDMLGHLTFLINGRHYAEHKDFQPGCESDTIKVGCSHHVAIELYVDSIVHRNVELKKLHADENPVLKSFDRMLRVHAPNLHPVTATQEASVIMLCVLFAIVLICAISLYMYFRMLLLYLKVLLILAIVICGIAAIAWITHRPAHGSSLLQETNFMRVDNLEKDYCEGIEMEHKLARCEFPFHIGDAHSGSTCPKFQEEKVTFGICAGPRHPEGLFLASIERDNDD